MDHNKREYKTISARISPEINTSFLNYCERKGVTPSWQLKSLIQLEIQKTIPVNKAGKNYISYNKDKDTFTWEIHFDDKTKSVVAENISPLFIEDISQVIQDNLRLRELYLGRTKKDSVPSPTKISKVVR